MYVNNYVLGLMREHRMYHRLLLRIKQSNLFHSFLYGCAKEYYPGLIRCIEDEQVGIVLLYWLHVRFAMH